MSDPDQQAPTNPEEPTTGVESEEIVVGADSTAEYQPVVTLQKVETATGEENDEVLYKQSVDTTLCFFMLRFLASSLSLLCSMSSLPSVALSSAEGEKIQEEDREEGYSLRM